jgi:hypothetical protein
MRWVVLVVLAACGDNRDPCNWHERDDTDMTGIVVGEHAVAVCGNVDGGHYDAALGIVDSDTYRLTVTGSGELLVQLTGDPDLSLFDSVSVSLFDTNPAPTLLAQGRLASPHGAFLAQVPPGDIDLVVTVRSHSDLMGTLPYRVRLEPDPSALCPQDPGPIYSEQSDGADMTGNDVALVDFTKDMPISAASGTAESTELVIEPGLPDGIHGVAGSIGLGDQYLDRDTYAITTGGATNELAVRLHWPDGTLDMDAIVFDQTLNPLAELTRASVLTDEFQFVPVEPNTTYWLWIGRFAMPPGPASEPYSATICGNYFY